MPDPLSMVAVGAAIGGAAGKVAERAWDSAEKWLREKFGSHAQETQQQARGNAANFVNQLAIQVQIMEQNRSVTVDEIANNQKHPQFSALLQQSVLNASQTDSKQKHDLLARLVATRLASAAETTVALASQLASNAIACSTAEQLMLMALCCFLKEIRPGGTLSASDYRLWLEVHLDPFVDLEFRDSDAYHLVAINCASYDQACERELNLLLQMKSRNMHLDECFADVLAVEALQMRWNMGLSGVYLTSVGSIVGGLALSQIMKHDYGLPTWDRPQRGKIKATNL